mmetsp:Transcript_7892/g.4167  ORF Transcript_7892/g.4167 Transcript_7892/m.4167 type:complete len:80 (+) Transcript_7892:56-295(+)
MSLFTVCPPHPTMFPVLAQLVSTRYLPLPLSSLPIPIGIPQAPLPPAQPVLLPSSFLTLPTDSWPSPQFLPHCPISFSN